MMDGLNQEVPRDWSERPNAERKVDYVPDIELATALRHVIETSFGVDNTEAIRAAFRLLGFRRTTDDGVDRGNAVISRMIQAGELVQQNGSHYLSVCNKQ